MRAVMLVIVVCRLSLLGKGKSYESNVRAKGYMPLHQSSCLAGRLFLAVADKDDESRGVDG